MQFENCGEELAMSKAKLQKTAEVLGVRDLKRLKKRTGTNKARAEVDDIANILQLIDEQGLLDKLPVGPISITRYRDIDRQAVHLTISYDRLCVRYRAHNTATSN